MLRFLVHACAAVNVAFAWRTSTFAAGWIRIPLDDTASDVPSLSVVVPARNEERNIERCVRSLVGQRLEELQVIVVDDRSTDRTRDVLAGLECEFPNLQVVDGEPLPEGWIGKPWALVQGASHATGAWVLFTDADSIHHPGGARSALAFARERNVDMLTIATHQILGSFAERAILPAILGMVLFATGPFVRLNDPSDRRHALANGQYMLFERAAYEALGTHAAVREEIAEDLEFARLIKRDGRFRMLIADGEAIASVRMYHTFAEIWRGFVKNVYFGANGNLAALAGGFTFTSAISWLPITLAVIAIARGKRRLALEGALCTLTTIAACSRAISWTGTPRHLGIYAPFGLTVFAAITATSTFAVLTGRGVEWRGRRYAQRR